MEVAIRVQDPSGTAARDVLVRIEDPGTVRDLVEVLVDVMDWPRETLAGDTLVYRLRPLGAGQAVEDSAPATALRLQQGDIVVLGPVR